MILKNLMIAFLFVPFFAHADAPAGVATNFNSPNGLQETCVIVPEIPGGDYSEDDRKRAAKNCAADFYDGSKIALCPKIWSTSAAVVAYDITETEVPIDAATYEATYCHGKDDKPKGASSLFKLKPSMNYGGQKDEATSGTYSPSSQVYYHFGRYFGANVGTPVAVYREIDTKVALERVAKIGFARSPKDSKNKAAWGHLIEAAEDPSTFSPIENLFTSDQTKFYGSALKDVGERYGTEINGARSGKGYMAQNLEFQQTAAFRALRVAGDLNTALSAGLNGAQKDRTLKKDLINVAPVQMVFWMRDLTEIALLDHIFNQQDRVGNVDFEWKWYWVQDGEVKSAKEKSEKAREKMAEIKVPAEIAAFNPVLVQRSHIGDNDAGVRVAYSNFSEKSGMLKNLNHFSAKIYTRLLNLDADLQAKGPIHQYLSTYFNLNSAEVEKVADNTRSAVDLLKAQCKAGTLRFDLDEPKNFLLNGDKSVSLDCDKPVF